MNQQILAGRLEIDKDEFRAIASQLVSFGIAAEPGQDQSVVESVDNAIVDNLFQLVKIYHHPVGWCTLLV